MRTCYFALSLGALIATMSAAPANAQSASGGDRDGTSWANVERLRPGNTIRLLCSGQRLWTGRLTRVSADSLALEDGGTGRTVARSEVLRVEVKSRLRSTLIGLGIGAAAGLGFGYLAGSRSGLKSDEKAAAVGLGASLFAGAGAGLGALAPSWKLVYSGEPSGSPPRDFTRAK